MNNIFKIVYGLTLFLFISCKSSDSISAYKLDHNKTVIYSGKSFLFKKFYFTYKNNQATLVYTQDSKIAPNAEPIFLKLRENNQSKKYQEFTDSSKKIVVKIISDQEVRLQLDRTRYSLFNNSIEAKVSTELTDILADVDIWKKENQ